MSSQKNQLTWKAQPLLLGKICCREKLSFRRHKLWSNTFYKNSTVMQLQQLCAGIQQQWTCGDQQSVIICCMLACQHLQISATHFYNSFVCKQSLQQNENVSFWLAVDELKHRCQTCSNPLSLLHWLHIRPSECFTQELRVENVVE